MSWGTLGGLWELLGSSRAVLFGGMLGRFLVVLGGLGGSLGGSWGILGGLGAFLGGLGAILGHLGPSWAFRVIKRPGGPG